MTPDADVPDHIEALADLLASHAFEIEQSCCIVSDMLREAMERRLADRIDEVGTIH